MKHSGRSVWAVLAVLAVAGIGLDAGVKVKVTHDKQFNFATVRTYAWHPDGAGEVKILSTMGDDPVKVNAELEPLIKPVIERELAKRGFVADTSGKPDLLLHYYVLIGPESESQFRGQFIGGVPMWGLPDFEMTTTALTVAEHGTVVLDMSTAANKVLVWRAVASAELVRTRSRQERTKRIDDGVTGMFKKFPPKFEKK